MMRTRLTLIVAGMVAGGLIATMAPAITGSASMAAASPQLSATSPSAPAARAAAALVTGAFQVDPVHSSVIFGIRHMDVANFYGRFNRFSGSMTFDAADPSASSVTFRIDAASVDTANERRDGHLRSPDFFNASEFSEITFTSSRVQPMPGGYRVTGDLTMHGVTKSITIELKQTGASTNPRSGKPIAGMEADFTIKRSDFNMLYGIEQKALADEVRLIIGLEVNGA